MVAQTLNFKRGLESENTIFWIDEVPYEAVTALEELPSPATVVGTFVQNKTLMCPANDDDCYTLFNLVDTTSTDHEQNIVCW